ncbi:MAG: orotidine-5'-phosphate decarboxylase [Alphaproteobacteria bacterium]|nr:MAG: orotidine-5'-phosphate decarboxylase [Alphaproteobacteria bacterium]
MRAPDRLIVALDVPTVGEARSLITCLNAHVGVYKIGLELLFAGGSDLVRELVDEGKKVFVDAKLLDISNTVEKAAANIAAMGAAFLTVHGHDTKTLSAAVRGRAAHPMKLLAVTVLTSLDRHDLLEQGIQADPAELVLKRARLARDAGFDGVIASGHEAAEVRAATGPEFLIVTPGIRPAGAAHGDQARIMTPEKALRAGADYLVVGRPITQAQDPAAAAAAIVREMEQALS